MQVNRKKHEGSFFSKIITIASLPLITLIWMIGWTLTVIGERLESRKSVQKTKRIHLRFKSHMKNFEPIARDKKTVTETPIET
jgi:hypothetical protein